MTGSLVFDPLLPWPLLYGAAALAAVAIVRGAVARAGAAGGCAGLRRAVLLLALANPSLQEEDRAPLTRHRDGLSSTKAPASASATAPRRPRRRWPRSRPRLRRCPNTELRVGRVGDGEGDAGTLLMTALSEALAEEPRARVAGAILITDGQVHDLGLAPNLPAPLHVLLTGRAERLGPPADRQATPRPSRSWARRCTLTLRIDDEGAVPSGLGDAVDLSIAVDGASRRLFTVPVGEDLELPVTLPHGGMNVLQFSVADRRGRTDRPQQCRRRPDQRRARPAARAAGLGRAACGRTGLAQPAEVRCERWTLSISPSCARRKSRTACR